MTSDTSSLTSINLSGKPTSVLLKKFAAAHKARTLFAFLELIRIADFSSDHFHLYKSVKYIHIVNALFLEH